MNVVVDTLDGNTDTMEWDAEHREPAFVSVSSRSRSVKCEACRDQPIWGCKLLGCSDEGCFIICPSCGREGFETGPVGWDHNEALTRLLFERLGR